FPTAKVIGGIDYVGEGWPVTPRTEDPDPIDFQGHGPHVADITGGREARRPPRARKTRIRSTSRDTARTWPTSSAARAPTARTSAWRRERACLPFASAPRSRLPATASRC